MDDTPTDPVRLTDLAHGGGCGCKIAPAVLQEILAEMPAAAPFANLLVGTESSDDAAVWKLNDQQALVATTDFFMPVVDDPYDFGRIAATNALSDVYAMGGAPILALALVGMPVNRLPVETIRAILAGGQAVCAAAGIPIAGGHSIDSLEPIYGLVALGLVHPDRVLTNRTAQAGDVLILGKALGVGILSAAFKQQRLDAAGYDALIASTTQLNSVGPELAAMAGVHAMTDVTGFGLLGHALEMARGAGLTAQIDASAPAVLPGVEALARAGVRTGASGRNWASYGGSVRGADALPDWRRDLLCDPQTSGGLLVAAAPKAAGEILARLRDRGFEAATVGGFKAGPASVELAAG
ncbi:MAG TPA: selenide, water dikinase SelD [Phenylobacterium sp.]|uniref:selenide, water dikinase SelD n=1 Tax=Phenylobacterium sp. TaxID=1871053 RepID=UPI002B45AD61|nr:selenide, water dikinase SelD [Phenylobacterium sp.]HKR89645.1 selenide, water dikinase SelD [Phenylobacterium sp.]